jgi:hypothetical protein
VGTYLLYHIDGASRIALVPDKAIAHTKDYVLSHKGYKTNDAMLLLIIFGTLKFCENFINEDNLNNTFALHYEDALQTYRFFLNKSIY